MRIRPLRSVSLEWNTRGAIRLPLVPLTHPLLDRHFHQHSHQLQPGLTDQLAHAAQHLGHRQQPSARRDSRRRPCSPVASPPAARQSGMVSSCSDSPFLWREIPLRLPVLRERESRYSLRISTNKRAFPSRFHFPATSDYTTGGPPVQLRRDPKLPAWNAVFSAVRADNSAGRLPPRGCLGQGRLETLESRTARRILDARRSWLR